MEFKTKSSTETRSGKAVFRRLLGDYVRGHLGRLGLAVIFMLIAAAATAANAWIMQPIVDRVFFEQRQEQILITTLTVVAIFLAKGVSTYGNEILMGQVGQRIIATVQKQLYERLIHADLGWFHESSRGKLVSNFIFDTNLLREAVSKSIVALVKDSLTAVGLIGVMLYHDWKLALLVFVVLPPGGWAIGRLGRRMRKVATRVQEETGSFAGLLDETFQGVRVVKAYGMEDYETARARQGIDQRLTAILKSLRIGALSSPVVEFLGGLAIASVIYYGGSRVIQGETSPGTFFSFIAALLMVYQPIKSLARLNPKLQEGFSAAVRLFDILDMEHGITDRPGAGELVLRRGEVRFRDVGFSYGGTPVLSGLNLTVPASSRVALVGPSGGGKSTILNLIPRFYDVNEGAVLIDGRDVRDVTLASLRRNVALVSQDIFLFNDTIRANIAYGRPSATDDEIEQAASMAAAHDFIMALPQGYDTTVGEAGAKLSGGQRQRISIARAMLKDAPILLLDEATSALDTEAERKVQGALNRLMEGRTSLVIAHRLSTVRDADCIHVIVDGRIVETGRHDELLALGGVYARLHATQFAQAQPPAGPAEEAESAGDVA